MDRCESRYCTVSNARGRDIVRCQKSAGHGSAESKFSEKRLHKFSYAGPLQGESVAWADEEQELMAESAEIAAGKRLTATQPARQQVSKRVVDVIRTSPLFVGDTEQARALALEVLNAANYYPLRAAVNGRADERMI